MHIDVVYSRIVIGLLLGTAHCKLYLLPLRIAVDSNMNQTLLIH
jgi:hypothetical protein